MSTFYVSYDVRKTSNYGDLVDKLKELKGRRILESVWTIKSKNECSTADLKKNIF